MVMHAADDQRVKSAFKQDAREVRRSQCAAPSHQLERDRFQVRAAST